MYSIQERPLLWVLVAAASAALFASGALVSRATMDDGNQPSPASTLQTLPGSNGEASVPNFDGSRDVIAKGGSGATAMPYPGCQAPLPAGVVANGVVDPSKAGFEPALPSSGFVPTNISLAAQGKCDASGSASEGDLVLSSSWTHTATGLDAYVSQMVSSEKVASVWRQDSATFWANGYVFNVSVNSYPALPASGTASAPRMDPAYGNTGVAASGAGTAGSAPDASGSPEADARGAEVLRELVGQIAPDLDQKCFWTQAAGDWSSLATLGIGDPRPAIPAEYTQTDLNVTALVSPAAGCDTTLKPTEGFSFNVNWEKKAEGSDFGYLGMSVYANGSVEPYPGQLSEYAANWSEGSLSFSVYAKSEKPIGVEAIPAIAKALDPSFNEACFIQDRALTDSELAGLGFHVAAAPGGYALAVSSLRVQDIAAGCPRPDGFQSSYNLNWTFQKGADTINASINRYGANGPGDGSGFQSPNSLNWTDASGTNYNVNAYSAGISPTVPKDDLVAVAKSMDPAFDLSKLQDGGPDKPIAAPMPADDKAR
jgi:hypothetical protein